MEESVSCEIDRAFCQWKLLNWLAKSAVRFKRLGRNLFRIKDRVPQEEYENYVEHSICTFSIVCFLFCKIYIDSTPAARNLQHNEIIGSDFPTRMPIPSRCWKKKSLLIPILGSQYMFNERGTWHSNLTR